MIAAAVRPIDKVLDAVHYAGERGRAKYMCHCPAHEDTNPSLSIREGNHGKVLVHCFAGCTFGDIVAALGLTAADLVSDRPHGQSQGDKHQIIANYDYRNERSQIIYQVVRLDPKDFRQRRPVGNGRWAWNLDGVRRVLYRLPELLAASKDALIYVVEGEKDADNLHAQGLVATCNAMGAGKWEAAYTEQLRGRHVAILPDNDEPGRRHAAAVAAALHAAAASVRIVELPDLPPKGDVSDWLAAGGTVESLQTVVDDAPRYMPPVPEAQPAPVGVHGSGTVPADAADGVPVHDAWPYGIEDGRLVRYKRVQERYSEDRMAALPIADFTASIIGELVDESGERRFVIEGSGLRGGPFRVEIAATDYADTSKLIGLLEGQSATDTVYAEQRSHVGPAIKKLSTDVWTQRRYARVGWVGDRFLIPGRENDGVRIDLPEKLPYAITARADLGQGLEAFAALLCAPGPEQGAVIAAYVLGAPLARLVGWANERYGLACVGQTGTLKTSTLQAFMALYGPKFMDDQHLIGPANMTRNAAMTLAAAAHDLPILFDNYKPNINGGSNDLVALVHAIVEGGDKLRLNRASEMREAKPVHTWPVLTGEDIPDTDAAALARLLVVRFARRGLAENRELTTAQLGAEHLCAVGRTWLDWLESDAGRHEAGLAHVAFLARREIWAQQLQKIAPDMANRLRMASNLAINALTFDVALRHPQLGPILERHHQSHAQGLASVAQEMGRYTTTSGEATRFLAGLTELLLGGRAILKTQDPVLAERYPGARLADSVVGEEWDRRGIGWVDSAGVYLLPKVARALFTKELQDNLGNITSNALYPQLLTLGAICPGKDGKLASKKLEGKSVRVLHVTTSALHVDDVEVGEEDT